MTKTENAGDSPSGLAANARAVLLILFVPFRLVVWRVCLARRAKRADLYQDKHTRHNQRGIKTVLKGTESAHNE